MNASTIINEALKEITLRFGLGLRPIESAKDVLQKAVHDLYSASCDDATWSEMCKVLLTRVQYTCDGKDRQFTVSYYRNVVTVKYEGSDTPLFEFTYEGVMTRKRESWDRHFMTLAYKAANRSTCMAGRKVGAQFAAGKTPLVNGFNGVPAGYPHPTSCKRVDMGCKTGEGLSLCPCNHAEINAIAMAAKEGVSLNGATLYTTSRPCPQCMGALSVLQPARIVYDDAYDGSDIVSEIAHYAGIELIRLVDIT